MTPAATAAPSRGVRVARAVGASTTATLVALAFHVSAGGARPPLLLVAAVCVLSWLPAVVLIGRRPSLARQAVVIALSELALHAVFAVGTAPAVPSSAAAAMPGMPGMGTAPPMAMGGTAASAAMWTAHAAAALVTIAAWNRGEAALRSIARMIRIAIRVLLGFRLPAPSAPAGPHPAALTPQPALHLRRHPVAAPRRGPPRLRTTS